MIRVLHSYLKLLSSVSSSEESVSFVGTYWGHFRLVLECWTDLILCRFCTGNHNYFEFMFITVSSYPGGMFDITSSSSDLWILYDSLIIDWQKSSFGCSPSTTSISSFTSFHCKFCQSAKHVQPDPSLWAGLCYAYTSVDSLDLNKWWWSFLILMEDPRLFLSNILKSFYENFTHMQNVSYWFS